MRRKFNKAYILSFFVLVILVSGAFLLPKLTLMVQDYQAMEDIRFSSRSGIDYEAINTEYETDVYKRMKNFADGYSSGRQFFITEGENSEQLNEKLAIELGYQLDRFRLMLSRGKDILYGGELSIKNQDYYVIYDQDANNGAALLCWYVELELEEKISVSLLFDAKDYTWYYLEFYDYQTASMKKLQDSERFYPYGGIEYMLPEIGSYYSGEVMTENIAFGYAEEQSQTAILENVIDTYPTFKQMADGGISATLSFGTSPLRYDVYYTEEEKLGYAGIAMGIREIRDLLPEEIRAHKMQK